MSVDVYGTEPERQAAIAEVTRLRRQFDTTTAKGAKAFAASPEAQAALARLDAAKKAAGMRTSTEDLAALNRIATSDTATMKEQDGKMVPAPTKAERAVTKQLNQPSRQYFNQVKQALVNPEQRPTWKPSGDPLAPTWRKELEAKGFDTSEAESEWILVNDDKSPTGKRWNRTVVGIKAPAPTGYTERDTPVGYGMQLFMSGKANIDQMKEFVASKGGDLGNATFNSILWSEIAENLPGITYKDLERLFIFYGNEVDNVEELVAAYEMLYGRNK